MRAETVVVRRIEPGDWPELKRLRLEALASGGEGVLRLPLT